jgi:predicted nucleotidyltransferase component of viral defense system
MFVEFRDRSQLDKANVEDALVELFYGRYGDIVMHGGTSIWRCYQGNRFSRDLDFYMKAGSQEERMVLYREISEFLKDKGFALKEKGYDSSTNTMHFLVESNVKMKVDINFNYRKGTPVEYTKIDESRMIILALTPEELLSEKVEAYKDKLDRVRKFDEPEAQDLYDIYHLVQFVKKPSNKTVKALKSLLERIRDSPPTNMRSLDHLIIAGLPPTFDLMIKNISAWLNAHKQ